MMSLINASSWDLKYKNLKEIYPKQIVWIYTYVKLLCHMCFAISATDDSNSAVSPSVGCWIFIYIFLFAAHKPFYLFFVIYKENHVYMCFPSIFPTYKQFSLKKKTCVIRWRRKTVKKIENIKKNVFISSFYSKIVFVCWLFRDKEPVGYKMIYAIFFPIKIMFISHQPYTLRPSTWKLIFWKALHVK